METPVDIQLDATWKSALMEELEQPYFAELIHFLKNEYCTGQVFPPAETVFKALHTTPLNEVKVVIIGQDPYHGPGQANGLCFSVGEGIAIPPSLQNIFKELKRDLGVPQPSSGDLLPWARQGVMLLNAALTVRAHAPGSHQKKGWERFTDAVIRCINDQEEKVVFMLWGSFARKKAAFVDRDKHLVLESPHPSPLSAYRGFLGNAHFSKANAYLKAHGKGEIQWSF